MTESSTTENILINDHHQDIMPVNHLDILAFVSASKSTLSSSDINNISNLPFTHNSNSESSITFDGHKFRRF